MVRTSTRHARATSATVSSSGSVRAVGEPVCVAADGDIALPTRRRQTPPRRNRLTGEDLDCHLHELPELEQELAPRIAAAFPTTGRGRPLGRPSTHSVARGLYVRHQRRECGCSLADLAAEIAAFDGRSEPYKVKTAEGWEKAIQMLERVEGERTATIHRDSRALAALKYTERRHMDWMPSTWSPSGQREDVIKVALRDASSATYSAQEGRYLADMARRGPLLWRTLDKLQQLNANIERARAAATGREPDTSMSKAAQAIRRWCELLDLIAEQEKDQQRGPGSVRTISLDAGRTDDGRSLHDVLAAPE